MAQAWRKIEGGAAGRSEASASIGAEPAGLRLLLWRSAAILVLGGAAFVYVTACARVCSLETERNELTRLIAKSTYVVRLQVDRLHESEEMRRLLVRQGFGPPAGVDEVVLVAPTEDVPRAAPRVAAAPSGTRRWLRSASSRVGDALADVVGSPAEASPVESEQP